jgi:ABC-2 type transport system permease protein
VSAKLWAIVKREYLERVRTKAFVIGTILAPLLMAAMMVVPMLAARAKGKPLRVSVVDATGKLGSEVEKALRDVRESDRPRFDVRPGGSDVSDEALKAFRESVNAQELDGYLVLQRDVLESGTITYHGRNVSNFVDLDRLKSAVGRVLVGRRLAGAGLDQTKVEDLTRETKLRARRVTATGEREDRGDTFILALILLMILYVSILMWGQMVMTSVIEEKTSRVVEVMASGVPPTTLLAGKLIGVGGAGLTQFLVWVFSLFGMSLASGGALAIGSFVLPEITPLLLGSFVTFFLLGYLFYSSLYASIGAAVNTVQEAQGLVFPVVLPLILAMVCWPAVMQSPDGTLAFTVSMIPGMSPLVMFLRIVILTPPMWQVLLSIALLVLGIVGVVWMAARIYRVGILMYGKRPTFPEIVRWVRHG